ncbi:MAG: DNA (cytosine-5-)-methyltransferase [Chakrabartia sp.]
MIRFVDLFAGIGGIRLGFEQALRGAGIDCECVLSSEIDEHARKTYQLNFGETPSGDIYKIGAFPDFDFLLAGFPCQPFSYAGKQKGFGDTRGTLFFEIERLLDRHRPSGFLLENVPGLVSHDNGRTFETILNKLRSIGYSIEWRILNSSEYDVPQNRVRVYIVGTLNPNLRIGLKSDKGSSDSHLFKIRKKYGMRKLVSDILESCVDQKYNCSEGFQSALSSVLRNKKLPIDGVRMIDFRNGNSVHSWELGIKGACSETEISLMNAIIANRRKKIFGTHQDGKSLTKEQIGSFFTSPTLDLDLQSLVSKRYLKMKEERYNPVSGNMSFEIFKFLDPESISITLVSSDAHKLGIMYEDRMRHITPRECARLQGYPDEFICHPIDTHAYRQFGNSVSVPVIKAVISDLFENNDVVTKTVGKNPQYINTMSKQFEPSEMRALVAG